MCAEVCKEHGELGTDYLLRCTQADNLRTHTLKINRGYFVSACACPSSFSTQEITSAGKPGCRQHTLTLARTYWMNSQILKFRS
ncbi:hypothetical protein H671_2g6220 [Cricetulus griseus]|uniref:Uncharacterized protein n=1 Tax=Cricetulus griseus TaxID=10029 RepID=A0A061IIB8_CRIGR|nr:hypothetical protein H671_2g6220 [Cricetulus griseus]